MILSHTVRGLAAPLLVVFLLPACGGDEETTTAAQTVASSGTATGQGGAGATGAGGAGTGGAGVGGAGVGGGGGSISCLLGTTWSVVDDFVFSPGEPSNPQHIAAGPAGELYAVGVVKKGMFRGMIRKSEDGGATWSVLEGAVDSDDPTSHIGGSGAVVDPAGAVYTIGGGGIGGPFGARRVHKSTDGGATWKNVDSYPFDDGPCGTGSIALGPDGVLHTVGSCDATGWIVRRSDDGGAVWTTVDTFMLAAGHAARSGDVFADAAGRVFVNGAPHDATDVRHWVVRTADVNGVWSTVDDYQLAAGAQATPGDFGGTTRVLLAGSALPSPAGSLDGTHWIVRGAGNDGASWTTTDDYAASAASTQEARGIYEDSSGTLLVVGTVTEGGINTAVARRSDDKGKTWSVVDTYSYVAGKSTAAVDVTSDPLGNVFVMLRGIDATDNAHWLVRKLACAP